jgi:hypothetical protein
MKHGTKRITFFWDFFYLKVASKTKQFFWNKFNYYSPASTSPHRHIDTIFYRFQINTCRLRRVNVPFSEHPLIF